MIVYNPTSRKEIRFIARRVRRLVGFDTEHFFPVVDFLERAMPRLVKGFVYDVVEDEFLPGKYAQAIPEENLVEIRQSTYEAAVDGDPRARFTIAHEVGHLLLADEVPDGHASYARRDRNIPLRPFEDPEWQANEFAAELLAPCRLVAGMNAQGIKDDFGVSLEVARIQLGKIEGGAR